MSKARPYTFRVDSERVIKKMGVELQGQTAWKSRQAFVRREILTRRRRPEAGGGRVATAPQHPLRNFRSPSNSKFKEHRAAGLAGEKSFQRRSFVAQAKAVPVNTSLRQWVPPLPGH